MTGSTLPWLVARFRPESSRLAVVVVLVVISVGFSVAGPELLGDATNILVDGFVGRRLPAGGDQGAGYRRIARAWPAPARRPALRDEHRPGRGVDLARLGHVLGLAALVYLLAAVSSWAQAYLMAGIALRIVYGLRQAVEDKLARLPLQYFDSRPHGEILSQVTNDLDNVTMSLQHGLSQLLTSVLTVAGVLGVMFWISPLLAAVSLVTIPLAIVVTALIARRSKVQFVAQWSRTGRLNGLVEETSTGHVLILAFGQQGPV